MGVADTIPKGRVRQVVDGVEQQRQPVSRFGRWVRVAVRRFAKTNINVDQAYTSI